MKLPTMRQIIANYLDIDLYRKDILIKYTEAFNRMVDELMDKALNSPGEKEMVWSEDHEVTDVDGKEIVVRAYLMFDGSVSTVVLDRDGTHITRDSAETPPWVTMESKLSKQVA